MFVISAMVKGLSVQAVRDPFGQTPGLILWSCCVGPEERWERAADRDVMEFFFGGGWADRWHHPIHYSFFVDLS